MMSGDADDRRQPSRLFAGMRYNMTVSGMHSRRCHAIFVRTRPAVWQRSKLAGDAST